MTTVLMKERRLRDGRVKTEETAGRVANSHGEKRKGPP